MWQSTCDSAMVESAVSRARCWAVASAPGCGRAAAMRRIERPARSLDGLQRHHPGDVGHLGQAQRLGDAQRAGGGHQLGAVDQGQPLLGLQHHRFQAGSLQRLGAGQRLPAQLGFALADHHQRQVRQRRQVARGPHRPLPGNDRVYPPIQHGAQLIGQQRAHPGLAGGQHRRPQQQHPPDDGRRQRLARRLPRGCAPGCVAARGLNRRRCAPRPGPRSRYSPHRRWAPRRRHGRWPRWPPAIAAWLPGRRRSVAPAARAAPPRSACRSRRRARPAAAAMRDFWRRQKRARGQSISVTAAHGLPRRD